MYIAIIRIVSFLFIALLKKHVSQSQFEVSKFCAWLVMFICDISFITCFWIKHCGNCDKTRKMLKHWKVGMKLLKSWRYLMRKWDRFPIAESAKVNLVKKSFEICCNSTVLALETPQWQMSMKAIRPNYHGQKNSSFLRR